MLSFVVIVITLQSNFTCGFCNGPKVHFIVTLALTLKFHRSVFIVPIVYLNIAVHMFWNLIEMDVSFGDFVVS